MWRHVDLVWTDVSEKCIAADRSHAASSLADFSTLKTEAIRSTETSVHTRSIRRHIPDDSIPDSRRCENLKSYTTREIF
jgi:hypothetical protein